MKATEKQIEAAAKAAYLNSGVHLAEWEALEEWYKGAWRGKVRPVVEAALNEQS